MFGLIINFFPYNPWNLDLKTASPGFKQRIRVTRILAVFQRWLPWSSEDRLDRLGLLQMVCFFENGWREMMVW